MPTDQKNFYRALHEGLGTTYERFVLDAHFAKIRERYGIRTVLEAPLFGMTGIPGINSLWWAREGADVSLLDDSRERLTVIGGLWKEFSLKANMVQVPSSYSSLPFGDKTFDMSWNFAALNPSMDWRGLLLELARVTRRIIFICLPNRRSVLGPFLSLLHKRSGLGGGRIGLGLVEGVLRGADWMVAERGYFDVPPWPDIAMSKEELCRKIGLGGVADRLGMGSKQGRRLSILDYYAGRDRGMKRRILRYGFLENGPLWIKGLWAHHCYGIFTPKA